MVWRAQSSSGSIDGMASAVPSVAAAACTMTNSIQRGLFHEGCPEGRFGNEDGEASAAAQAAAQAALHSARAVRVGDHG